MVEADVVVGVSLATFRNSLAYKQILLVQNDAGIWIMPGGKLEEGEIYTNCLLRECAEELGSAVTLSDIHFWKLFSNLRTPTTDKPLTLLVYFGDIEGEIVLNSTDSIIYANWFSADNLPENLSLATRIILDSLHESGQF
jgi:8-oxo-dGTP pyrophosphatase MutT (NUDIX family)